MQTFYFMMFFAVAFVGGILAMGWAQRQSSCPNCGHTLTDDRKTIFSGVDR